MAAAQVLAIPELLQHIFRSLPGPDSQHSVKVEVHRHAPSLVDCLRVNLLWFHVAKAILWADIYTWKYLNRISPSRKQIYADSIQSLLIQFPHFTIDQDSVVVEPINAAYLTCIQDVKFPRLKSMYIVAKAQALPSSLCYLPTTAEHIYIRFARTYKDFIYQLQRIQDERFGPRDEHLYKFGPTGLNFSVDPRAPHEDNMRMLLNCLETFPSIKSLVIKGSPFSAVELFEKRFTERPELRRLEISHPLAFDYAGKVLPPLKCNMERLTVLHLGFTTALGVCNMLKTTRNLREVQLGTKFRDITSMDLDVHPCVREIYSSLIRNTNLTRIVLSFDLKLGIDYEKSFMFADNLISLSNHCRELQYFSLEGFRATDLSDEHIDQITQNLPDIKTFILKVPAKCVTSESLRIFSQRWPYLENLLLRNFFDVGQLGVGVRFPYLETLGLNYPYVWHFDQLPMPIGYKVWKKAFLECFPHLRTLILGQVHGERWDRVPPNKVPWILGKYRGIGLNKFPEWAWEGVYFLDGDE